jgi:hypothetical protein
MSAWIFRDMEAELERAQGVAEQLRQQIVFLEQNAAAAKEAASSRIADLKVRCM